MKKHAWSWSRLDIFEQCPRKYQLMNILKVPNMAFKQSPAQKRGDRLHEMLKAACEKVVRIKRGAELDAGYPEEIIHLQPIYHKLIMAADEFVIDEKMALNEDLQYREYFGEDVWLRFSIDLGVKIGNRAICIDWKTGRNWGPTDQLKLMAVLAMLVLWPDVEEVVTYYYYIDGDPPAKSVYYREDLDVLWEEFMERQDALQVAVETNEWPCKENRWCGKCDATPEQCEQCEKKR